MGSTDRTYAGIPAQDGVVVAGRSQRFGQLVPLHGLTEAVVGKNLGRTAAEQGPRLALPDEGAVVEPVVLVDELLGVAVGVLDAGRPLAAAE